MAALAPAGSTPANDLVNFESPHVHPLDLDPSGTLLAACNTADGRVELFDVSTGLPEPAGSIPVGSDPVSARFRTPDELWVVNQISDSVSIVDVPSRRVRHTLSTLDEPADVVFAGSPLRAFVSCSQANALLVFDPENPDSAPLNVPLEGEDPRSLAVSPSGDTVYAAIFESGNGTTILGGGADESEATLHFPPNAVNDPRGPHGGVNPPANAGNQFEPAQNPANPPPPAVGLIIRRDDEGRWRDDTGADWSDFVSGPLAPASGRPPGWELVDHDLAVIEASSLEVSYVSRLMNLCMTTAVNPLDGAVAVAGTDAINHIRFEPVLNGRFLRVQLALIDPENPDSLRIEDLNPHLDYAQPAVDEELRSHSFGDPRAAVWSTDGSRLYIAGLGSDNIVAVDAQGNRTGDGRPITVGEGPTGLALAADGASLFVLNRFEASVSVVDLAAGVESSRVPFFDPSPEVVRLGRRHLYNTTSTSGLGHVSCASCHVDARMDRLAWDLGDPAGEMIAPDFHNLGAGLPLLADDIGDFHPMKGPMTTQTLQDIIGKEPHHWRGDREGLEAFNPAFTGLLGRPQELTRSQVQEFEDFLATIHFPPNPYRNLDNSLPENLPLPGHHTSGRFAAAGSPLPPGNAQRALTQLYRPLSRGIDRQVLACVTCHTLPTGLGTNTQISLAGFVPVQTGPNGELHHALVSVDGSTQKGIKIAQLRNLYDKIGFEMTQTRSQAGFGFIHDGSVDSLSRFVSEEAFDVTSDQEVADLVALMLAFSGSDYGDRTEGLEPPGTSSLDAHAAVGRQVTLDQDSSDEDFTLTETLIGLAVQNEIDLIVRASPGGVPRAWLHEDQNVFQSDRMRESATAAEIFALAENGEPVTFTAVPWGTGRRAALDRDRDGLFDGDETRNLSTNPNDPQNPFDPASPDSTGDNGSLEPDGIPDGENDFDGDGISNAAEFAAGTNPAEQFATPIQPLRLIIRRQAGSSEVQLSWEARPGAVYRVQYSSDLFIWIDSPSGPQQAGPDATGLSWIDDGPPATDPDPADAPERYYRVMETGGGAP
ncbi:MAG TPA: beta-propeller fold lactonase family protein [Verrucomicrobiales bacterium]|nr:beta-propeller fold lactonase family protein [Verrucomicrobiales bacterium]